MPSRRDRLVWAAVLFRTIRPEVVEGAIIRRSERLHWSRQAAIGEVQEWVKDLPQIQPDDKIEWQDVEDNMSIGRFVNQHNYVAVARAMFLPMGKPPRATKKRQAHCQVKQPSEKSIRIDHPNPR